MSLIRSNGHKKSFFGQCLRWRFGLVLAPKGSIQLPGNAGAPQDTYSVQTVAHSALLTFMTIGKTLGALSRLA